MHVMDVMCNQHSRFEWKRNIVLFERDFFFDYEKALRDQLSPVICQHAGCWSVFFRCRYHHCKRGLVEAIALTTLIIVHSLRSLFPVGLQKHDLAFMRKWLVTWQRMGRIYLEQNPFNQTRFDPTFEPLTHVHSSLHNWFPKQWREMENRDSRKVLMSQMPHGFEPVELLSAFTKKPKKPELKVSMAS